MNIGKNIQTIRQSNNLNQTDFASKLGYAQRTISGWENNASEPSLDAIRKIKEMFNVTYEELLD